MRVVGVIAVLLAVTGAACADTAERLTARLVARPPAPAVGTAWTARFELRRGGRPAHVRAAFWIARGAGARRFTAVETGAGRYRASVSFPSAGAWSYGIAAGGSRIALGRAVVAPRPVGVVRPMGLAVSPDGQVAIADGAGGRVLRLTGTGALVSATPLAGPISVAFDRSGSLYAGDDWSIFRLGAGAPVRVAGNGSRGFSGDGGPATAAALGGPTGFAFDSGGRLVIAEYDGRLRAVRPDGTIETIAGNGTEGFAGDGGPARAAVLAAPHDLDVLADGSIVVADSHNGRIRRIDAGGTITTIAAGLSAPVGVAAAPDGSVVVADAGANRVYRIPASGAERRVVAGTGTAASSGDGGPATRAGLNVPIAVAVTPDGTIYVTEFEGRRVRRIDVRGVITTIARAP